jgi:hypothetical protein
VSVEIKHKTKPGYRGYTVWGCRCDGCVVAGQAYLRGRRKAEREKREQERAERGETTKPYQHGITGYREHNCRCELCISAHWDILDKKRVTPEPPNWDDVAHLRPGAGVRRRAG